MLNQSYFHTIKFNLGDYYLGDLGLGDFNINFNLGDLDLIPKTLVAVSDSEQFDSRKATVSDFSLNCSFYYFPSTYNGGGKS